MAATASERLAAAGAAVDHVCQLLLSPTPEQMEQCTRLLETAVAEVTAGRMAAVAPASGAAHPSSSHLETQGQLLKSSIGGARRLLESANSFYANWIRCLGALCAGYTEQGRAAAIQRGGRLLARG